MKLLEWRISCRPLWGREAFTSLSGLATIRDDFFQTEHRHFSLDSHCEHSFVTPRVNPYTAKSNINLEAQPATSHPCIRRAEYLKYSDM